MSRRAIRIALVVCAVVAVVIGGIYVAARAGASPVEVYPVSNISGSIWSSNTVMGAVSEGRTQDVALRDATVEAVHVTEGQEVKKGDVLVTYDTSSFAITVQKDEAAIAVLEADIAQAEQEIARLGSLQPSENAPQPTYETIDHGELALVSRLDGAPEDGAEYLCSTDTVVTAAFLKALRESGAGVTLALYSADGDMPTRFGTIELDGSELPEVETTFEYEEVNGSGSEADTPSDAEAGHSGETPLPAQEQVAASDVEEQEGESPQNAQPVLYTRTTQQVDPLDESGDWTLGEGIAFTGDGAYVSAGAPRYGTLTTQTPEAYERYETVEIDPPEATGDNYVYSRAELVSMIAEQRAAITSKQLDLREARVTLAKDQLTAQTGEVTAAIDGTVTAVNDPATLTAGQTLVTVSGGEDYGVTLYVGELALAGVKVGDVYDVSTWQSGQYVQATVTEVGSVPVAGSWAYGDANPNTSWYPVTCVVENASGEELSLVVGEGCEATSEASEISGSDALVLDMMYVRSDDQGSYVMVAGSDGRLERRAVTVGRTYYGSMVEVTSGLSQEDRVAFPYGTDVVAGARTVDADYPSFY